MTALCPRNQSFVLLATMPVASATVCAIVFLFVIGYGQPSVGMESDSVIQDDRWSQLMPHSFQPRFLTAQKMADQRYHPVQEPESQLSPVLFRMIQSNAIESGGKKYPKIEKRNPSVARALAMTINRKIRAEGENVANMLQHLKHMEECMKLSEGLRFRKRGDGGEGQQQQTKVVTGAPGAAWRAVRKRTDSSHRIRALNTCQL